MMTKNHDSNELWRGYLKGDSDTLSSLYSILFEPLLFQAIYFTKDPEEAKDIVSDLFAFFIAYPVAERNHRWKEIRDIESFLAGCIRKKCLDYLKKKNVRRRYQLSWANVIEHEVQETETIIRFLEDSLRLLSNSEQELMTLHFNGFSNNEIAEKMNIKEKTVRNKLSLSRAKLARIWQVFVCLLICFGYEFK